MNSALAQSETYIRPIHWPMWSTFMLPLYTAFQMLIFRAIHIESIRIPTSNAHFRGPRNAAHTDRCVTDFRKTPQRKNSFVDWSAWVTCLCPPPPLHPSTLLLSLSLSIYISIYIESNMGLDNPALRAQLVSKDYWLVLLKNVHDIMVCYDCIKI